MSRLSLFAPFTSTNFVNGNAHTLIHGDVVGSNLSPQPMNITRFVFNSGEFGIKILQTGQPVVITLVEEKGFGADNLLHVRKSLNHLV